MTDKTKDNSSDPDLSILREGRRKPSKLPLQLFGTEWEKWLIDAANGAGAPVDYVAGTLLSVTAALIGNSRRVQPWEGWVEPSALWIANVGNPSSNKSPATDPVINLIRNIENDMAFDFEATQRDWQTKKEIANCKLDEWEMAVKKAVKDKTTPPLMPADANEPQEIPRPRILGNDSSTEKLGLLLAAYNKGLLFHRDELSGWLGGFDRYSGAGADRAFWTEAYGGRSYIIDRVKHPQPIRIPYLLVGVMGGIQPDKLIELMQGADDGLLSRFLWFWPDPIPPFRPVQNADNAKALAALKRISKLTLDVDDKGNHHPRIIPLVEDATALFQQWRIEHHAAAQNVIGLLASSYGKAPGHVLRLALALQYLWWAITPDADEPNTICKKALAAGAHLVDSYGKPMAENVFADASIPEDERLVATLARYIVKNKKDKPKIINLRTIRREARLPGLRKPEKVKLAAEALVEGAWLLPPAASNTPGRPREDYTINPKLWEVLP